MIKQINNETVLEIRKSFTDIRYKVSSTIMSIASSTTISVERRVTVKVTDVRWKIGYSISPNIDQNTWPKERTKKSQQKHSTMLWKYTSRMGVH